MRRVILLAAALSLVGCSAASTAPSTMPAPPGQASGPDRGDVILAVAGTAASVADAINVAPPATLSRTVIDEKAVRLAFVTFDNALGVIDAFVASGRIVRNSPAAVSLKRYVLATKDALQAASAAQRAGQAATYTAALRNAEASLAGIRSALAR